MSRCAIDAARCASVFAVLLIALPIASAAEPQPEAIGLFAAVDQKLVEARFIAKSDEAANLIVKNLADRPLRIEMPAVVAGVPVLAQFNGPFGGPGQQGGQPGGGNQTQAVAGGPGNNRQNNNLFNFNGNGNGNGNQFFNGIFNIAPERVRKIELDCVCLEHGKKRPRAAIAYALRPVEETVNDPRVIPLVKSLRDPDTSRRVVQAAVWHLNNDMSWDQLAAKRREHIGRRSTPYYTRSELQAARTQVEKLPKRSPGVVSQASASATRQ